MPISSLRFLFATILLALAKPALATTNTWLQSAWSSDDGLPNNTVNGLVQTRDGFLWLGTSPNGLARFDGLQFEEFSSTNFIAFPNRGILAMSRGRGGAMHLGMDRGAVVSLSPGHCEVYVPDEKLSLLTINSVTEDSHGVLWICYRDGNVGRIENGEMTLMADEWGLPAGTICSMVCDAKGQLWFTKAGNLGVWRNGAFESVKRLPATSARMALARDGGVWVCAGFRLLKLTEAGELQDRGSFLPRQPNTETSVLIESRDGAVWIGTTFSGLFRFDGGRFEPIPTTHQAITSLLEDDDGNIWVGTGGGGLNQIRRRAISVLTAEAGVSFEGVSSLCEDNEGVIWAATQNGGLARFADGRWQLLPADDYWSGDAMSLCADPSGGIWVGTRLHRLLRWQNGRFVNWGDVDQLKGQTVHTLVVATNGDVWVGEDSPGGIQRLRDGRVTDHPLPPQQDIRVIRASVMDAAGRVWFATSKGILMRIDGERLVDETALLVGVGDPQPIRGLAATPDGSLWIGFAGWGVGRVKDGKFARISARQGLHDDYVSQIISDDRGWLWFGADRGLFKVRQDELDAVAEGSMTRVRSVHYGPGEYGSGDGRPSLQANFGNAPIALRSRDGRVWLAMRTGLVVVDPSKLREQTKSPTILVTRASIGDTVVVAYGGMVPLPKGDNSPMLDLSQAREGLRVWPDHRRLEFEFTALSYVGAENSTFRYQLEGMDDEWTETSQRSVTYQRLSPGPYRFRVIGCNSEGVWNDAGAQLAFIVDPFFWQTWWFRVSVLAVFTVTVIAIVRYVSFRRLHLRLQHLEQQAALHKERARIAKDIHDDLGASLTQVSLIGELARQDSALPSKVGEHIEKMSLTARRAVKSLDEIVWAVNPRNDTLAHFIDYTGQYALDYLQIAGLRCRLDLPDHVPARELSTDVRHNLFLVVKEAITNTVKHSQATELRLQVIVTTEKLSIIIEDNGHGFDQPKENATSDGLRNMRQRAADIGGACWVQGRPGAGAKVTIELPWTKVRSRA